MKKQTITALRFIMVMTILCGIFYPVIMTGIAQLISPFKANGSLIRKDGTIIGSELIGQNFDSTIYFWSRPSVIGYKPVPSGASNLGPASKILKRQVESRRELFLSANRLTNQSIIPNEMLFASGSGLDPHISPGAALLQVDRICEARHFNNSQKEKLLMKLKDLTEPPQFMILGEERINVLILNIELDKI